VVVAGAWRRPSRAGLVTALVIAIGAGSVLAMQLPRVASARANYGVDEWNVMEQGHSNQISGDVGLNVLPTKGLLQFRVYALEPVSPERPIKISLRIDGRAVDERVIVSAEPLEMRFLARDAGFEYVELHATNASGQPAQLRVDIGR
jgi:hypothetical protein